MTSDLARFGEPGSRLLVLGKDVVETLGSLCDIVRVVLYTREMFLDLGFETTEE
jgi:hypothetical protein